MLFISNCLFYVSSFRVTLYSNTLTQWSWGGGSLASSTLSCSHTTSHHIAGHCKALHRAQQLSSSKWSPGSCTGHAYKCLANHAKVLPHARSVLSRYPRAHPTSLLALLPPAASTTRPSACDHAPGAKAEAPGSTFAAMLQGISCPGSPPQSISARYRSMAVAGPNRVLRRSTKSYE